MSVYQISLGIYNGVDEQFITNRDREYESEDEACEAAQAIIDKIPINTKVLVMEMEENGLVARFGKEFSNFS